LGKSGRASKNWIAYGKIKEFLQKRQMMFVPSPANKKLKKLKKLNNFSN
jgi:hypothetical protein